METGLKRMGDRSVRCSCRRRVCEHCRTEITKETLRNALLYWTHVHLPAPPASPPLTPAPFGMLYRRARVSRNDRRRERRGGRCGGYWLELPVRVGVGVGVGVGRSEWRAGQQCDGSTRSSSVGEARPASCHGRPIGVRRSGHSGLNRASADISITVRQQQQCRVSLRPHSHTARPWSCSLCVYLPLPSPSPGLTSVTGPPFLPPLRPDPDSLPSPRPADH